MSVKIDITGMLPDSLVNLAQHPESITARVIEELTTAARQKWANLARTELGSTSKTYIDGLQEPEYNTSDPSRPRSTLELTGVLPTLLEQGWAGGRMQDFLCGPNAKNRKPVLDRDGKPTGDWYNTIPLRHGTPGNQPSAGQAGSTMGAQYSVPKGLSRRGMPHVAFGISGDRAIAMQDQAAKDAGKRVYKEAKALAPTTSQFDAEGHRIKGQTSWGGRLPAGLAPKIQPEHATDPFAGMVRERATYEKGTQSQYYTFRRISTRGRPWMHPGLTARNFVVRVRDFVVKIAPAAIRQRFREVA